MEPLKPTIIRQRRRSISLHINPDATLTVKAPYLVPGFIIDRFIKEKEDWIRAMLAEMTVRSQALKHKFVDGEEFLYLGKSYKLRIMEAPAIALRGDAFIFPFRNQRTIKKRILEWYKDQALAVVTKRVEEYAKVLDVKYIDISLSNAKKRWGACTSHNALSFNWKLIMAPLEIMDYVVIHELSHILEHNHSKHFWAHVGKHCPEYKMRIRWLKRNGDTLEIL